MAENNARIAVRLQARLPIQLQRIRKQGWRSLRAFLLGVITVILSVGLHTSQLPATLPPLELTDLPPSQYASTITAPFNQPDYYAIPSVPPPHYRPVSDWVGRLILPTVEQYQQIEQATQETDWAWFEVYTAPETAKSLIGQTVRLAWQQQPLVQAYVNVASRDVRMAPEARTTWERGIIHPIRLHGRDRVGPLQSLAGARPFDDVVALLPGQVMLEDATAATRSITVSSALPQSSTPVKAPPVASTLLRINREPLQQTGVFYGLVKFVDAVPSDNPADQPSSCPGEPPCVSNLMRVRHYNANSGQFDGAEEIVRIPQQPADWEDIYNFTTRELTQSPAGESGWYIYGAPDRTGRFTVQALQPRSLIQLTPDPVVLRLTPTLRYITYDNWKNVDDRKGTLQTVWLDPTTSTSAVAPTEWQEGDRALVMHLFGGRGGTHPNSEVPVLGTYAGHFSFGLGQVVRDPFTNERVWQVDYLQVYGNGSDGTLSGGQTWAAYMGDLRRGKAWTRPISDVLVKLDTLTEAYTFGDTRLSFFDELLAQLSLVGARYRIGDGTGDSTITSATSCVQDSAQALFLAILRLRQKIESNPQIVQWMQAHPTDPTTQRFRQLVRLGRDLSDQLTPMGVVRWDWQQNAEILTGVRSDNEFISIDDFRPKNLLTGLISWRTALPRQAHDELARLFLRRDATLWVMRPNQIGGVDPSIAPLEPTLLLGKWTLPFTNVPLLSYLVIRTFGGVSIPTALDWLKTLGMFWIVGAIALPVGFSAGVLRWYPWQAPWYRQLGKLCRLLAVALGQEYVFRVLALPYPKGWFAEWWWWSWAGVALGLYVGSHLLYAQWKPSWRSTFFHPTFLLLITLLGIACTVLYRVTGSLWTITVLHGVVVSIWWFWLGGWHRSPLRHPKPVAGVVALK